jgi:thioredoxin reductase
MPEKVYDILIIGRGPAGTGAAVQAKLYGLEVMMAGEGPVGGRLNLARRVENFPWPKAERPPSGPELCRRLEKWLDKCRIPQRTDSIIHVSRTEGLFKSSGRSGKAYLSKAVVMATGVRSKAWRAPRGKDRQHRMVENWKEIAKPRGAYVAVIGGGEVAFDQACSLAERGAEVLLLMRGSKPRAYAGLVAEAARMGVNIIANMPLAWMKCDDRGAVLKAKNGRRYCCDYVLPAVGHRPQRPGIGRSALARLGRGLWLAGDVRERHCRQAAVAYGDGVRAAMLAWEFLRKGER